MRARGASGASSLLNLPWAFLEGSLDDAHHSPTYFALNTNNAAVFGIDAGKTVLRFLATGTYLAIAQATFGTAVNVPPRGTILRMNFGGSGLGGSNSVEYVIRQDVDDGIREFGGGANDTRWNLHIGLILNVADISTVPTLLITVSADAGAAITSDDCSLFGVRIAETPIGGTF